MSSSNTRDDKTAVRLSRLLYRPEFGAVAGLVIVYVFFAFTGSNGFVSVAGTASWLNQAAELGVLAIFVGMLMIGGEFDLSVGSVISASSMIIAIGISLYDLNPWICVLLALSFAACVGFINGLIVVRTGLHSFIVTLAGLFIVAGFSLGMSRLLTNTTSVSLDTEGMFHAIFGSSGSRFNVSILWFVCLAAASTWIMAKTVFGNWVYATGGNRESALAAGVPVVKVKIILFMLSSMSAALVAALVTVQYNGGNVTYGRDFVFTAPVAAVVGGVLLTGGYGSTIGVCFGSMILAIVSLGIFYTGWNTDWTQLAVGGLLLLAVLGNSYFRRLALGGR